MKVTTTHSKIVPPRYNNYSMVSRSQLSQKILNQVSFKATASMLAEQDSPEEVKYSSQLSNKPMQMDVKNVLFSSSATDCNKKKCVAAVAAVDANNDK